MDLELLTTLTQTFGPSGYEAEIRAAIRRAVEPLADTISVDPLGTLVARRQGNGTGRKILLAAHMDEIGVMVTHVDEKGFLRFTGIGGVFPLHCVGSRVRFANGTTGVIYVERQDDPNKVPTLNDLFIDTGATSRDDAPVGVGEPAVFVRPLEQQGRRLISKALDDRLGCYVLIETLRRLQASPHELYFAFTVQEEFSLSGARTTAFRIEPDLAIAVDVTGTGDTPKALPMAVALGQGPAVKVQDGGMIAHPQVRERLIAAARRADLPYQLEVLRRGTTDAAAIQLAGAGVPSGCLSIPTRYIHSPSEMADAGDVEKAVQLLLAALTGD